MISKIIIVAICLSVWLILPGPTAVRAGDSVGNDVSNGFVAGVTDLPLMPGLLEVREATLVFDKLDGRLVRAVATGIATVPAVWRFYEETLPQLGWRRLAKGRFSRDGERLAIEVEKNDSKLTVRFAIAPQSE